MERFTAIAGLPRLQVPTNRSGPKALTVGYPLGEGLFRHAKIATLGKHWHACFGLAQSVDDLLLGEALFFHVTLPIDR